MPSVRSQYKSKAVRLSETLDRDIRAGKLSGAILPPAQELAPRYRVSQPTMRRALDLLGRPGVTNETAIGTGVGTAPRQVAFLTSALNNDADMYLRSISGGLEPHRLTLATYSAHADVSKYLRMIEDVVHMRPAGIILATISPTLGQIPGKLLADSGIPVVLIGPHPVADLQCDRVDSNGRLSGAVLARHLREKGYRDIAVLATTPRRDSRALVENLRREMALVNVEIPDDKVVLYEPIHGYGERPDPFTDAQNKMAELLADGFRCEVLVCGHDYPAVGALRAILAAGLRVPEDMKVVSDSRCIVGGISPMKLTTVDHHSDQQGRLAAELLARRLEGHDGPVEIHYAPVTLIEGETE